MAAGILAIAVFLVLPRLGISGNGQNLYYAAVSAATTITVLVGARRVQRSRRLPWLLLAAGQLSYMIGDIVYFFFHAITGDNAFPTVADAFYLLQYPLTGCALILLARRRTPAWDPAALLDASILATGLGLLWWVYLIEPLATAGNGPEALMSTLVSVSYPVMDVIVLAVALHLAVGSGARSTAFRLLLASLVAMLGADMLYGLQTAAQTYHDGGAPDVLWLCEYILLGAAALHPTMRRLDQRAKVALPDITGGRLLLLSVTALLPLGVLYVQHVLDQRTDATAVVLCGICLLTLIITRMWMVVGMQQRMAIVDELTGLKSRGVLLSHLDLECERARHRRHEMGIVLLDVDGFKPIWQTYGQPSGHEVLAELARRLVHLCGNNAILGRIGDNRFAAVLPGFGGLELVYAGTRIREAIEAEEFPINDDENENIRITVSVGIASLYRDGTDSIRLLGQAEKALEHAQAAGRNQVFSPVGQV